MKRLTTLMVGGGLALAASNGIGASAAYAQTPIQQGWWTSTNPGLVEGSPTPPAPPDVPSNGLLIEGGTSSVSGTSDASPTAFAALVYEIPAGDNATTLTLTVAPTSATTPSTVLELCSLVNPAIRDEHGGPMSDAPAFNCTHNVTASPSSSGDTYGFNVSALVSEGALGIAILPTSPTDRVVLAQPAASSLTIQPPLTPPTTSFTSSATIPTTAPAPAGGILTTPTNQAPTPVTNAPVAVPAPVTGTVTPVALGSTPALAAQSPSTTASPPTSTNPDAEFAATATSTPKAKPWVVGLLIAAVIVGGALWLAAGRAAANRDAAAD